MRRPQWVSLGLYGIKSRRIALAFMWISLALAVALLAFGILPGLIFFAVAAWYLLAIRWVDRWGEW